MSLREVAFAICTTLDNAGIQAVLTGGSAATFYAPEAYQSSDLDFVVEFAKHGSNGADELAGIGFEPKGSTYVCKSTVFTLDFPSGPLAVGGDFITKWSTEKSGDQILYIISATDSVRDRLAWFYFANDFAALAAALAVAIKNEIDLELIRTWSQKENSLEKFEVFLRRLERA